MKLKGITISIFFYILFLSVGFGQSNPLFSDTEVVDTLSNSDSTIVEESTVINEDVVRISFFGKLIRKNAALQNDIKNRFAILATDYSSSKSMKIIMMLFFLAFIYGVFHSLGPGHGKIFIFSYILTEKPKVIRAISISYMIAFIHAISGLVVALGIIFILKEYTSFSYTSSSSTDIISRISFGIMIIIGLYMIFKTIFKKNEHHHESKSESNKKQLIPFVLTAGLVPCPGTIIIVTFLASLNLLYVGILSVIFIILGMGITISAIGIISIFSKKLVLKLSSVDSDKYSKIYKLISLFGAFLLTMFGVLFFIGTI